MRGLWPQPDTLRPLAYDFFRFLKRPLSEKTGHAIAFAPEAAERLADRMDVDLRQLERMVRAAFAMALQAGDKVARLKTPGAIGPVGFSLRDWVPQQGQPC